MRALLTAVGTRGDVQPALALALELKRLGHEARLCVSPGFVEQATRLGLDATPMGVEMRMPAPGSGPAPKLTPEAMQRLRASMPDLVTDQFVTIEAAVEGCDVIVGCNAHQYAAPSVAEHRGIPSVTAVYAPVAVPSRDLAPPLTPGQSPVSAEASLAERWAATAAAWNERARERIDHNRARLGLGPIEDVLDHVLGDPTWLAADAALAPAPDAIGRAIVQTGAWVIEDTTPLPAELEAFLAAGEPPLFVGFGSMPATPEVARAWVEAARAAGRRVLVSRGWAELDVVDGAADALVIGDVAHDRLFPRVAAVVHHGGAGTTATAARAGVPQVIAPMFSDQPYWASRVVALGVGVATSQAATNLVDVLAEALDPETAATARALAEQVGNDGAATAARRLETLSGG